jgi:hypothetical protein
MGEAKRKSRNRTQVLTDDPRCIYCLCPSETWEHMPPKAMFKNPSRLSGMEFGCCEKCNTGTKSSDAIASFIAHISPTDSFENQWQLPVMKQLLSTANQLEPGFEEEFFNRRKTEYTYRKNEFGFLMPVVKIDADGPILKRNMTVFSAKMGMALYREHVGKPMAENSGIFVKWFLNAGLNEAEAHGFLSFLPAVGEIKQGKQRSIKQFGYRYNCDDRSLIMAMIGFHSNLHILVAATSDLDTFGKVLSQYKGITFVKFGELTKLLEAKSN